MLAEEHEAPERYDREVWSRHPVGLVMIAVLSLLVANFLDLHALSAAASAGFIMVFALVNVANVKLAEKTQSKRWISLLGAIACLAALAIMLFQIAGDPKNSYELYFIAGLAGFPFLYQVAYRAIKGI
jgi:hypothetical protein